MLDSDSLLVTVVSESPVIAGEGGESWLEEESDILGKMMIASERVEVKNMEILKTLRKLRSKNRIK